MVSDTSIETLRSALSDFHANNGLVRYLWPVIDAAHAVVAEHDSEGSLHEAGD